MLHQNRRWSVTEVGGAEELAAKLTETTWCCCAGFSLGGYLWLNDATGPDGAQEYAVVKRAGTSRPAMQVESITYSWCTYEQALESIERTLAGDDDGNSFRRPVAPRLETPEEHGSCGHCA